jgi:hypothetical protein
LGSLFAFAGFFVAGVLYRKRPAIHKRLMVLATVVLVGATVARLGPYFGSGLTAFALFVLLRLSPAFVTMGYDRWTRGRVHPVYWIGIDVMVLTRSRFFWAGTDAWLSVGHWLIEQMQPVVQALL